MMLNIFVSNYLHQVVSLQVSDIRYIDIKIVDMSTLWGNPRV